MPIGYIESVARYTRFVLLGKRALWVLAVVLLLAIIVVAWVNSGDLSGRLVFGGASSSGSGAVEPATMMRPRYQGIDAKGRPFSINADRALQRDSDNVILEKLSADMMTDETAWLALTANTGLYNLTTRMLDLEGAIHLFYEGGHEFRTERARIDVNKGEASGDTPVEGQGPSGTLKADGFTILDQGAILRFTGHVKVVLFL